MISLFTRLNGKAYNVQYTTSPETLAEKLKLSDTHTWGLDIETGKRDAYLSHHKAGLDPYLSFIRLIQLYDGKKTVYVLDTKKSDYSSMQVLKPFFESKKFIAHNALFELAHLAVYLDFKDLNVICSMILAILIDRAERSPFESDEQPTYRGYGLAPLCRKYLGVNLLKEQQTSNWNDPKLTKGQLLYAANDAIACYKLSQRLAKKLKKYKMNNVYKLFCKMQHVITDMQLAGMPVSEEKHHALIAEWEQQKKLHLKKCDKYFKDVNLNSPKQMNVWLTTHPKYRKLLPHWPKTDTGAYTFQRSQIVDFLHLPPIKALMEYKKHAKLLSTYGFSMEKHRNPYTGRYHTNFNLAQVRTGRLSSSNPNLQNMPRDSGIRDMFDTCDERNVFVVADFSQIEMRVAAELSRDKNMLKAYREGKDLHRIMASVVSGKSEDAITKEERQLAKAVNFGFLFGMGAPKFVAYAKGSYNVVVTEEEAYRIKDKFYDLYEDYIAWCDSQRRRSKRMGFVRTPMGRMRKLLETEVYTKAVNTPVQGGAAEVLFLSMLILRRRLSTGDIRAKLSNCVHDEIIVECEKKSCERVKKLMEESMIEGMLKLFPKAPVNDLVEAHYGRTWEEAK